MGAAASVDFGSTTSAYANVYWRDVVYYSGATIGSSIRLSFTIKAFLGGATGGGSYIGLSGATSLDEFSFNAVEESLGLVAFYDGGIADPETLVRLPNPVFTFTNWDQYDFLDGIFIGQTHLDVPYNEEFDGFSWQIRLRADASAHYSSSFVSSMNSVGLTAVTDLDGNPITGLSFDSGMVYVPEVPSMYLAPGAGIILFTLARLHSMRKLRV
jgi:hypothetical protein